MTFGAWAERFNCAHIRPLIVCRGPVRKEVIDVFADLGIPSCGILLSDKDSISQDRARAPELRNPRIALKAHAVSDYSGADATERSARIEEIINICRQYRYDSVFAGYGFMAEDIALVSALERANLRFIGPNSGVVYAAGFKDEAKRIAHETNISVTPGVDQLSALALLRQHPDCESLRNLARKHKLGAHPGKGNGDAELLAQAEELLLAAREAGTEILGIDALCAEAVLQVKKLFVDDPGARLRLKAVGGGGGKGQRIVAAPASYPGDADKRLQAALEPVAAMVRDVLSESKATGVRDNRNILIERNVENTRHQEIQMVGNGNWFITMGGRDCSLQMHEQKLLEVSITDESLAEAIDRARARGNEKEAATLEADRNILRHMEEEANNFARAVGLNSVSTFECIVSGDAHYFMEVNTRIQVEHRVSELCYALRFVNPDDADDYFEVESLVHLMVLLAVHAADLPEPGRVPRAVASIEARLNATNDALLPHAGGLIEYWSQPATDEVRDDQGISTLNPDTGSFLPYRLTGAYDSNIALLLATGSDRRDSMLRLAEILRRTVMMGTGLATNLDFHRGLLHWLLGTNAEARPSNAFVNCYLVQVAQLYQKAQELDLRLLWQHLRRCIEQGSYRGDIGVFDKKLTLLLRPLEFLLGRPHLLSGWASYHRTCYARNGSRYAFNVNSWSILRNLYHYLSMSDVDERMAQRTWESDQRILEDGEAFYAALSGKLGAKDDQELHAILARPKAPAGIGARLWSEVQASHRGFQCGNEMLLVPYILACETGFYALGIDDELQERVPKALKDPRAQSEAASILAPPPAHSADEIVAESGGMFYRREMPDMPPLVEEGQDFASGDPLCVIEVMKMFNKMHAPFAGTVEKILIDQDGEVVQKGQPLFKIKPFDAPREKDDDAHAARRKRYTETLFDKIYSTGS